MTTDLLVEGGVLETRVALVEDGRIVEFAIERPDDGPRHGDVFLGRVVRVLPAGAFVDLGRGPAGFLSGRRLAEGAAVVVQVRAEAYADKGPKLAIEVALAGRLVVYRPHESGLHLSRRLDAAGVEPLAAAAAAACRRHGLAGGLVLRRAAGAAAAEEIDGEIAALAAAWRPIAAAADEPGRAPVLLRAAEGPVVGLLRDHLGPGFGTAWIEGAEALAAARRYCRDAAPAWLDRLAAERRAGDAFARFDADEAFAAALDPLVALPGGGRIALHRAGALTAIDVDTGGAVLDDRHAQGTNIEAARAIARELRLRNIAGLAVVDFAGALRPAAATAVLRTLRSTARDDPAAWRLGRPSPFGLLEIARERRRASLADSLGRTATTFRPSPRSLAAAALRQAGREAAAAPGRTVAIRAAPPVIAEIERVAAAFAAAGGAALDLRRDPLAGDDVTVGLR